MGGITGTYYFKRMHESKFNIIYDAYNEKFIEDNIYEEDEDYIIALEGCLLNIEKIKSELKVNSIYLAIRYLFEKYKEKIIKIIRGAFILIIYNKQTGELFLSNDLLSKRPLYIYKSKDYFMFSSRYNDLVNMVKTKDETLTLNKLAAAMMLSNGQLEDNVTYASEICYVMAYQYIVADCNKVKIKKYEINKDILSCSESTIINELDLIFSNAVDEQYQKNKKHGYKQLSTLSAGMDSRSCLLYANKLGYNNILCVTYSQSNSVDFNISKRIAYDYNYEYIFYPLDSALFLLYPDILCKRNECQQDYAGSTGAYQIFNFIDTTDYGIIHTGLLGGELLSDIFIQPKYTDNFKNNKALKIPELPLWDKNTINAYKEIINTYENREEILLFKYLRSCQNFNRMIEYKCEAFSPFMHEDFFEYAYRIQPEYRYRRKLYKNWMNRCIPNNYITTYFKTEISSNYMKEILIKVINRFMKYTKGKNVFDMNPFEYWSKSIPELTKKIDKIIEFELGTCPNIPNDIEESIRLVKKSGLLGCTKAITLLKAIKKLNS